METPKIQLAASKAIIKTNYLQEVINEWKPGDKISPEKMAFFSSILEPEDFFAIPDTKYIKAWEFLSTPTISPPILGSVKKRGVIRPVFYDEYSADTISASINSNVENSFKLIQEQAEQKYRSIGYPKLKEINDYVRQDMYLFGKEGLHDTRRYPILADWSSFLIDKDAPIPGTNEMFYFEEYLRTGRIPMDASNNPLVDLSKFTVGAGHKESVLEGIERIKDTVNPESDLEFVNRLLFDIDTTFGRNKQVNFTDYNKVFDQDAENEYRRRFVGEESDTTVSKVMVNGENKAVLEEVANTRPVGFFGDIVDDIGIEESNKLYMMIHDTAKSLGYVGRRETYEYDGDVTTTEKPTRFFADYQTDVYETLVSNLKKDKDDKKLYEYFKHTAGLQSVELEQLEREKAERAYISNPAKAQEEFLAKQEVLVDKNIASQLRFFFDTFKMQRNEYREYLDMKDYRAAGAGLTEEEATDIYNEGKVANDILDENEKEYKRLEKGIFVRDKNGKLVRDEEKTPKRPVDKLVMATSGNSNKSDNLSFEDFYTVGEELELEELLSEQEEIHKLLMNPNLKADDIESIQAEIEQLKKEVRELDAKLSGLDSRLSKLEFTNDKLYRRFKRFREKIFENRNTKRSKITSLKSKLENKSINSQQKRILEGYLSDIEKKKEAVIARQKLGSSEILSEEEVSFRFLNPEASFKDNVTESYRKMVAVGEANYNAAIEKQQKLIVELDGLMKAKPVLIDSIDNVSRESGVGLRSPIYDESVTFDKTINMLMEKLDGLAYEHISDEYSSAKTNLIKKREIIREDLKTALELHQQYGFGNHSARTYLSTDAGVLKNEQGIQIVNMSKEMKTQYESFLSHFRGALNGMALVKHDIADEIKSINDRNNVATGVRLKQVQDGLSETRNVISNLGYMPSAMGANIVENNQVYQMGLSKEDYIRYTQSPEEIEADMKRLDKHSVLVKKATNEANVSSWLDAERKGRIIRGTENDTVGFTVKVSPDQKTAAIKQVAISADSLRFLDTSISNKEIINAVRDNGLDLDIDPNSHVVDMEPVIDYTDNKYISVVSDTVTKNLFKINTWDEKKAGYVKDEIKKVFEGQEFKPKNLTAQMVDEVKALKEQSDSFEEKRRAYIVNREDEIDSVFAAKKEIEEKLARTRYDLYKLKARQEKISEEILTASAAQAKKLRAEAAEVVERIKEKDAEFREYYQNVQERGNQELSLRKSLEHELGRIESLEVDETLPNEVKELIQLKQTVPDEAAAFDVVSKMFNESEVERIARNEELFGVSGIDSSEFKKTANQFKIDKDKFMSIFITNDSSANNRLAFNSYAREMMGAYLPHVPQAEYGEAAAGYIAMYLDSEGMGKEFDLRVETYSRDVINELTGGVATDVEELSDTQRATFDRRVEAYKKMDVVERLKSVLFTDLKSFLMKESFASKDAVDEPAYAHSIRQVYKELVRQDGASGVNAVRIHQELLDLKGQYSKAFDVAQSSLENEYGDSDKTIKKSDIVAELDRLYKIKDEELFEASPQIHLLKKLSDGIYDLKLSEIEEVINFHMDTDFDYEGQADDPNPDDWSRGDMDAPMSQLEEAIQDEEARLADREHRVIKRASMQWGEAQDVTAEELDKWDKIADGWDESHGMDFHQSDDFTNPESEYNKRIDEIQGFMQQSREEQLDELGKIASKAHRSREKINHVKNIFNSFGKEPQFKPRDILDEFELTSLIMAEDDRWQDLLESKNPYYTHVDSRMSQIQYDFEASYGNIYDKPKLEGNALELAKEYKALREFAFTSMVDPKVATSLIDLDSLAYIFREGELSKRMLEKATTHNIVQAMDIAEKNGNKLRAVIPVPGEDFTTEVVLRKRDNGDIEAYSEDLKQGFIVNETGEGKTYSVSTSATPAYGRTNNLSAGMSASQARPIMRTPLPSHALSKRKNEATNISNITSTVVDAIQTAMNGDVIMSYDIETTMTGAKKIAQVVQPIDIYAEKIQFDKETGELQMKDGKTFIKAKEKQFFEEGDTGRFDMVDVDKHSSFAGYIALNEESKKLLDKLSSDPTSLVVDFGDKKDPMHISDIANLLEWKKDMSDEEAEKFNSRKKAFLIEHLNGDKSAVNKAKSQIDYGLEHLRFLSNVGKYGMSIDDRSQSVTMPEGMLTFEDRGGAFELMSKNTFIPSHDEIMNQLLYEYTSGNRSYQRKDFDLSDLFVKDESGAYIRADNGGVFEKIVVNDIQSSYTNTLIGFANEAKEILDSESRSKEAYGQHILHYKNVEDAAREFRLFAEMDNVKALLGSNPEKADNITLLQSLIERAIKYELVEDSGTTKAERGSFVKQITNERNQLLNDFMSQYTEEYGTRFVFNPARAEEFKLKLEERRSNGEDVDGYIRSRKSIVVSDLSDAVSYLPILSKSNASVVASKATVKAVDKELADLTHAYEVVIGTPDIEFNATDRSILERFGLEPGKPIYDISQFEEVLPEHMKLKEFFENTPVIDQQITARSMFTSLRSLSNDSIMNAMGLGTTTTHASNVDVGGNIKIHNEFISEVFNILKGGEVKYPGVKAILDNLGITNATEDIYEQGSYKVGDYVFMKEAYDSTDKNKSVVDGQVGVYRIEELDEGFTSFKLSRQILNGDNQVITDTTVKSLEFKSSTNALFEAKAAEKLRFISAESDESVVNTIMEYQSDITRGHFADFMSSENKYYIHLNQNQGIKAMNNGVMPDVDQILEMTGSDGVVEWAKTPFNQTVGLMTDAQAILEQKRYRAYAGENGMVDFTIGSNTYSIANTEELQTIQMGDREIEVIMTRNPVSEKGKPLGMSLIQVNPNMSYTQSHFSEIEQALIRSTQNNPQKLLDSEQYYVDELSKEHMLSLNAIDSFNNTLLGQETRRMMTDLTTLTNMGAMHYNTKTNIIRSWNEALIEQAKEYGAESRVNGMAVLDRIDYQKTVYEGADGASKGSISLVNTSIKEKAINVSSPKDIVDSVVDIAKTIGREYKDVIPGDENKETHIATKFIVDSMIKNDLLPENFKDTFEGNVSLDHLGVSAYNHVRKNGISNPLKRIDYLELADIMESDSKALEFAADFRANRIDNVLSNLTLNQQTTFKVSKKFLNALVDESMYVNGINTTIPVKLNLDDAITLDNLKSKSFLKEWSIEQLVTSANSMIGSDNEVALKLNQSIYKELANRASGEIKGPSGIDPEVIRASGDMERINAAVALNWLSPSTTDAGDIDYSVVPMGERRIAFSQQAGMKFNQLSQRSIINSVNYSGINEKYNYGAFNQMEQVKEWRKSDFGGHDMTTEKKLEFRRVGGVLTEEELAAANEEIIARANARKRPDQSRPEVAGQVVEPSVEEQHINNVGADGQPLFEPVSIPVDESPVVSNVVPDAEVPLIETDTTATEPKSIEKPERIIEPAPSGRPKSASERLIADTKSSIRDKMDTFLHGSSGGKWVAGLGVAAAALYAVNAMGGPLKLEDRPQGHGVKGFAGAPEDDNRTQRETKSVQVDTSSTAYVNSGDKGYTIQAKGRAGSNIDTGQLQNAVGNMQGASSVNVNIRDDRSSIDSNWLENQFSNYINRGYAGE